jgi:hypothetical protein
MSGTWEWFFGGTWRDLQWLVRECKKNARNAKDAKKSPTTPEFNQELLRTVAMWMAACQGPGSDFLVGLGGNARKMQKMQKMQNKFLPL